MLRPMSVRHLALGVLLSSISLAGADHHKFSSELKKQLVAGAHPAPSAFGAGWDYTGGSNAGRSKQRFKSGNKHLIVSSVAQDDLPELMRDYTHEVERWAERGFKRHEVKGIGDEAVIFTDPDSPDGHRAYLRVRACFVRMQINTPPAEVGNIMKAYAAKMADNAQRLLGAERPPPPPIPPDRGPPAVADKNMFKAQRKFARGSSSSTSTAHSSAGRLRVLGRRHIAAGEDFALRIEFQTRKDPPAGSSYRDRPYLKNLEVGITDLWRREVPPTALGAKVLELAEEGDSPLVALVPDGDIEFQIDVTGWWQLSNSGTYFANFQWPVFDAAGKELDRARAMRFLILVK